MFDKHQTEERAVGVQWKHIADLVPLKGTPHCDYISKSTGHLQEFSVVANNGQTNTVTSIYSMCYFTGVQLRDVDVAAEEAGCRINWIDFYNERVLTVKSEDGSDACSWMRCFSF